MSTSLRWLILIIETTFKKLYKSKNNLTRFTIKNCRKEKKSVNSRLTVIKLKWTDVQTALISNTRWRRTPSFLINNFYSTFTVLPKTILNNMIKIIIGNNICAMWFQPKHVTVCVYFKINQFCSDKSGPLFVYYAVIDENCRHKFQFCYYQVDGIFSTSTIQKSSIFYSFNIIKKI